MYYYYHTRVIDTRDEWLNILLPLIPYYYYYIVNPVFLRYLIENNQCERPICAHIIYAAAIIIHNTVHIIRMSVTMLWVIILFRHCYPISRIRSRNYYNNSIPN